MVTVESYPLAMGLCIVTMLCWGSWANTQKLASRRWPFQLFYWDYANGVLLSSLILAFTLGSLGSEGRSFLTDLAQADPRWLGSAALSGAVFNLSNILLVAAIDTAGMAVAFPIGVGLALVLGVITTYLATRTGHIPSLVAGVLCIVVAIGLDAIAYRRLASASKNVSTRGLLLSVVAGLLMGGFYSLVAQAIGQIDPISHSLELGKLSPYTALVLFSVGLFFSNFLWNGVAMARPISGPPIEARRYFTDGSSRIHAVGILGGLIWNAGMALSIIASHAAGAALSYGLGQGATLIGAVWGVFVWREFRGAPAGTSRLLTLMFVFYIVGIAILVASKA